MSTLYNRTTTKDHRQKLRNDTTPQERILWKYLKGDQRGCKFRRQFGIGDYIIDFFCAEKKLAIEIDGSQHFEESATHYDAERSRFLESRGCTVLRFSNDQINTNVEGVVMRIDEVLSVLELSG